MNKLNFLIVGTQKSGTTALHHYLSQHIDISLGSTKEVHYFDNDKLYLNDINYTKYHEFFNFKNTKNTYGEVTPIYCYWDDSIKRIYKYNPNIKIIIILRNPIFRAFSHWNMEKSRASEELSFFDAISNESKRLKQALPNKHRVYSYIDRGYYTEQLRNIYRYFDKTNVLVLFNDDLKHNRYKTLDAISDFLSIAPFSNIKKENIFSIKYESKLKIKEHKLLYDKFYYEIKSLSSYLNRNLDDWLNIKQKRVLFFRHYKNYQGGHQKVFDYYEHFENNKYFDVDISFSKDSIWDESNPWSKKQDIGTNYNLDDYDIYFIAGHDWDFLGSYDYKDKIVINLLQGIQHTYKENKLYSYLQNDAIRICVSPELEDEIIKTNLVNSKLNTIINGHKIADISIKRKYDFYILGLKNKELAKKLELNLLENDFKVICTTDKILKNDVLINMSQSNISILLPNTRAEGFYLPALESMKLSNITIVPDCIGNRSFCFHNENCLVPEYNLNNILKTAIYAISLIQNNNFLYLKEKAIETLSKHTLERERNELYKILEELNYE